MAWEQITVDLDDVASTLNSRASGTLVPFTLTGVIELGSLHVRVYAVADGRKRKDQVDLIWQFTSGGAVTGWDQSVVDIGQVDNVLPGSAVEASVHVEAYGKTEGKRLRRQYLVVWRT